MSYDKTRLNLMNAIYQFDLNKYSSVEDLDGYFEALEISEENKLKLSNRLEKYIDNIDAIDTELKKAFKDAKLERLSYIDRALLRLAIFEIYIEEEIAYQIIINDIVEIAKNFSDDNSYKFINAILGDYVRNYYHE
ncbi:transcription antitermination factor NusB [uncultured Fenollaria sp.]|uniref:transcription antitermination factor NusB n=1 Tax=uncultured Fenollaria sp. TaxID=1686315 RepID=UPI0025FDD341|nr:transcription antitermination factor NusB [uncultured Fenollaria sp.]